MNIEEQKEMLKRRIEELEQQSEKKKELKKLIHFQKLVKFFG